MTSSFREISCREKPSSRITGDAITQEQTADLRIAELSQATRAGKAADEIDAQISAIQTETGKFGRRH